MGRDGRRGRRAGTRRAYSYGRARVRFGRRRRPRARPRAATRVVGETRRDESRRSRVARSAYKRFFARRSLAGSVPSARFLNRGGRGGFATSTRELALHALAHDGHGRGWRARDRQPAHGRGRGERPRRGQAPRAVGRRQRTARLPRAGFGRRRLGRRHRRFRRLERRRLRRPVVRSRAPRRKRPFPRPREPLVPGNPSPPTPAQIFDPPTTLNGARKHLAPWDPP